MKKTMFAVLFMFSAFLVLSCTPVTVKKCVTDFKYDADNRLRTEYEECIEQTPEKLPPIHLKHQELYE